LESTKGKGGGYGGGAGKAGGEDDWELEVAVRGLQDEKGRLQRAVEDAEGVTGEFALQPRGLYSCISLSCGRTSCGLEAAGSVRRCLSLRWAPGRGERV